MLSHIKIYFLVLTQLIYLITISAIRPMNRIQENIIQICNDAILFALFSILVYFDREERWRSWTETVYIQIMVSGNILSALIVLVSGIVNICKRIMMKNKETQITPKAKGIITIENNDFNNKNKSSRPEEAKDTFSVSNNSAIDLHPSIHRIQNHHIHNHEVPKSRVHFRILKFD